MKKTGLLVLLMVTAAFAADQPSTTASTPDADGIIHTAVNVPSVRYQTPTQADLYCAGFITKDRIPDANYVNGGLQTPTSTKFEIGELVYLAGGICTLLKSSVSSSALSIAAGFSQLTILTSGTCTRRGPRRFAGNVRRTRLPALSFV